MVGEKKLRNAGAVWEPVLVFLTASNVDPKVQSP